jgi:hypothetical protein
MPSNTVKYFSCIYCGADFTAVKPDDRHTKANKHKINRDDIETLHKCSECGKNNKLYWSEQKKSSSNF